MDSTVAELSVFYLFVYQTTSVLAMCILIMQRPGDTLNALYPFDATF